VALDVILLHPLQGVDTIYYYLLFIIYHFIFTTTTVFEISLPVNMEGECVDFGKFNKDVVNLVWVVYFQCVFYG
jgi:hypothetical protein